MRIKNQSGQGQDLGRDNRERTQTFRKTHKPGQKVSGRLLKWDQSGLAWVSVDGIPLRAEIASGSRPGTVLHFIIQSLTPEIVLKVISGPIGSGGNMAMGLQDFHSLRSKFESSAYALLDEVANLRLNESDRKSAFLAALCNDQEALKRYSKVLTTVAGINAGLVDKAITLVYPPWLVPVARQSEMIIRKKAKDAVDSNEHFTEIIVGMTLKRLGPIQMRLMTRHPQAGFRIFVERLEHLPALEKFLKTRDMSDLPLETECLGVSKTPKFAKGGILHELLTGR